MVEEEIRKGNFVKITGGQFVGCTGTIVSQIFFFANTWCVSVEGEWDSSWHIINACDIKHIIIYSPAAVTNIVGAH